VDRIVLASGQGAGTPIDVYLISETGPEHALMAASNLRLAGFRVDFDTEGRRVEAQFKTASRLGARSVVVLRDDGEEVDVRIDDQRARMPAADVPEFLKDRL
jgi:histidyl-tRNA synthetase